MWLWILFFVVGIVLGGFGLRKYLAGDESYWPSRNVFYITSSKIVSFFDRMTFKVPFHELDLRMYKEFKKCGHPKFGGIVEMRNPALFVMDLDLVKHIMVSATEKLAKIQTL